MEYTDLFITEPELQEVSKEAGEVLRLTARWRKEVQHNRVKMEFYRALLKSGLGKMTESKLENACFLFGSLKRLEQRNRKLYKALLELQNRKNKKNWRYEDDTEV